MISIKFVFKRGLGCLLNVYQEHWAMTRICIFRSLSLPCRVVASNCLMRLSPWQNPTDTKVSIFGRTHRATTNTMPTMVSKK